jgi:hypothetical protein
MRSSEARLLLLLLNRLPVWLLLAAFVAALVLAYQKPQSYQVDVGTPQDQAYVVNMHSRLQEEGGQTYRWSDVYGYVRFPGLGGQRPFTLTVELDPARVAPVTLIVNGATLFTGTLQPDWQTVALRADERWPEVIASRDTVLELRAPDYRTEDAPTEPKGLKVGSVRVEQVASGGLITPPLAVMAYLTGSLLLFFLLVGRSLLGIAARERARGWAFAAALTLAVGFAWAVTLDRVAISAASMHLVLTLGSALALLIVSKRLSRRLAPRLTVAQHRMLGVSVAVAFALRFGGMGLPQSVIVDMPWHMKWLRTLLAGDWQSLYFPGGLSSVPAEWGLELLIPKSPLFYFAFAPLGILPFDLETLAKWLVCLLDASLVLVTFAVARRVGAPIWAAVAGAALYAAMPLAFRAFAYGILPTIFAQWLAALALLLVFRSEPAGWGWVRWTTFTLLLTLSLLAFPTVALFVTVVLCAGVVLRWAASRSGQRRFELGVLLSLAVAWGVAVWLYYGIYISPMVDSAKALLLPRPGGGATVRWPGGFAELLAWTADYVVTLLPVVLALAGLGLLLARAPIPDEAKRSLALLLSWAAIAPVFLVANYRVDMIGKHLFFTMLPVAIAGGVALWALWRRGGWNATLASLALATVCWQALVFWVDRLVRAST